MASASAMAGKEYCPPAASSPSPELNPLTLGGLVTDDDGSTAVDQQTDVLAPLPEYKAAGETVLDFDGLLQPAPPLRLREDLAEGCGGQTWPAGMVLARHLLRYHKADMATARILELGAGGGLVGLAVALACRSGRSDAAAGAANISPVHITDQVPMLALMQHNIALNGLQDAASASVLNWGEPLPAAVRSLRPTVVLAADCVYFEPAFPLLLATLDELLQLGQGSDNDAQESQATTTSSPQPVTVYFCFKKRRRADMYFLKQAQKRFAVAELADDDRPVFSRQGLFLYAITRKQTAKTR